MGGGLTFQSFFITMLQIVHGLRIMPAFVGRLPTETVHVGSFSAMRFSLRRLFPKRSQRNNPASQRRC
jgi:hypothetical protein